MSNSIHKSGEVLATIVVMSLVAGCSPQTGKGLWVPTTWPGKPNLPTQAVQGKPVLYVRFDLSQLQSPESREIEFPLPDGTSIVIAKTRDERPGKGEFIWHGKVAGDDRSIATLVVVDGVLVGDIVMSNGGMYRIAQVDTGVQAVFQLHPSGFSPEAQPLEAEEDEETEEDEEESQDIAIPQLPCSDANIDVLVAYTKAACGMSFVGNGQDTCSLLAKLSMKGRILQAMGETNTIFGNSGSNPRINVIHTASTGNYTEAANLELDLTRLKYQGGVETGKTNDSTPYLDAVHGLRDQYGADVVSLITKPSSQYAGGASCGQALLMRVEASWFEKDAFTVVPVDCMVANFSFGHELGHLMGANHEGVDSSSLPRIPGNRAFVATDPQDDDVIPWRTVMAEFNVGCTESNSEIGCVRLPYFSNPALDYLGDAMGTDEANNSQVVASTADTLAQFRPSNASCDNQ